MVVELPFGWGSHGSCSECLYTDGALPRFSSLGRTHGWPSRGGVREVGRKWRFSGGTLLWCADPSPLGGDRAAGSSPCPLGQSVAQLRVPANWDSDLTRGSWVKVQSSWRPVPGAEQLLVATWSSSGSSALSYTPGIFPRWSGASGSKLEIDSLLAAISS